MKPVNPNTILKPAVLSSQTCKAHLLLVINGTAKPDEKIYNGVEVVSGVEKKTVIDALKLKYNNKCGYCEREEHDPTVDHHRPKNKVQNGGYKNRGYYWLCYEWSNFVASCTDCNKAGSKHIKFEIQNKRKAIHPVLKNKNIDYSSFHYNSDFLKREGPLLLHPEYSKPIKHLKFDLNGVICGIDEKGKETVITCNLDRKTLNVERRKVYEYYWNKILELYNDKYTAAEPLTDSQFELKLCSVVNELLIDKEDFNKEYTLFRQYMYRNFTYYFIEPALNIDPRLPEKLKESLIGALKTYLTK